MTTRGHHDLGVSSGLKKKSKQIVFFFLVLFVFKDVSLCLREIIKMYKMNKIGRKYIYSIFNKNRR